MSAARRVHGGVAVRNGRLLVLCGGASNPAGGCRLMPSARPAASRSLGRELAGFAAAVFVGSLGGLIAAAELGRWLQTVATGNLALAIGTTLTGAAHARLVHGQSMRSLAPRVVLALPIAYGVMHEVHRLLGG